MVYYEEAEIMFLMIDQEIIEIVLTPNHTPTISNCPPPEAAIV